MRRDGLICFLSVLFAGLLLMSCKAEGVDESALWNDDVPSFDLDGDLAPSVLLEYSKEVALVACKKTSECTFVHIGCKGNRPHVSNRQSSIQYKELWSKRFEGMECESPQDFDLSTVRLICEQEICKLEDIKYK